MRSDEIAMVCHETNRAYCVATGDYSQLPWDDAPEWQRESAVKGVEALIADPSMTPRDLHVSWCKEKEQGGWVYGPIKDAEKKTHPCLVEYEDLPVEQQKKDYLFQAIVRVLADLPKGYVTT